MRVFISVKNKDLLNSELQVINLGIDLFYNSLKRQGIKVIHVDWKPVPMLDPKLEHILSKIL